MAGLGVDRVSLVRINLQVIHSMYNVTSANTHHKRYHGALQNVEYNSSVSNSTGPLHLSLLEGAEAVLNTSTATGRCGAARIELSIHPAQEEGTLAKLFLVKDMWNFLPLFAKP